MTQLAGATVLVTGATGGFGQELTRQLLQKGSRLILTDIDGDRLAQIGAASTMQNASNLVGQGQIVGTIAADLSTQAGVEHIYTQARSLGARVDILVNNAGIAFFGYTQEIPPGQLDLLMQINLLAPIRLTSLFLPDMIAQRRGHIVNISSAAGWAGMPGLTAYVASKFGLRGFGEALAPEVRPHNIQVSTVYPFFSRTPILTAPHYGSIPRQVLPDRVITNPEDVIRTVVAGIERNQQHIFPDPTAFRIHLIMRFVPWALPYLNRRR